MSQKKKEFAVRPFSSIKGIRIEEKTANQPQMPEEKPASTDLKEDDLLFLREMQGIKRIRPVRKSRSTFTLPTDEDTAATSLQQEDDSHLFLDTVTQMKMDLQFSDEPPEPRLTARRKPAGRLRQLRRGTIRLDLEIDLNGLNEEEALDFLASFITAAYRRKQQAVLIITGKGTNHDGNHDLYGAVTDWLTNAGQDMVAEFSAAPAEIGGPGALVVFLCASKH
jgi:DNA-nicking Smr family endonuclease